MTHTPGHRPGRRLAAAAGLASLALAAAACGGGGYSKGADSAGKPAKEKGPVALKMLIASSGDAETGAVKAAAAAWGTKTGNTVDVAVAQDLGQQLGQAFAGGTPPDLFYTDASRFPDYVKAGALYAYGDQVKNPDDFYAPLKATFTSNNKFYCAPKDFSTLGLQISKAAFAKAGLTDADIPTAGTSCMPWRRSSRPVSRSDWRSETPATASTPSWCRPAGASPTPTTARSRPMPRRT